ncbi:pumilio homolog 12-like [Neltuma alba]|uniref:pumilio homolog 12-like n=1 Tax=Neltuma alba TaxID=207710 RepID=UPI0010A45436|nr:pumilio homolog 12-like [Prosopis alba]
MDVHRRPSPLKIDSANSASSPSGMSLPDSLFQNHCCQFGPDHTLEESFARLSIPSSNHSPPYSSLFNSALDGGAIRRGYPMESMLEKKLSVQNIDCNNQGVGGMRPQNYYVGSDIWGLENSWSPSYPTSDANEHYSNYFAMQQEVGTSFPTVPLSNGHGLPFKLLQDHGRFDSGNTISYLSNFDIDGSHPHWLQPSSSLQSIGDFRGNMLLLAKHQFGCRLLQEMMTGLKTEEISLIFSELIEHVSELMLDPFGNYVFQKMLEVCTEEQRTEIILMVTKAKFQLVNISLNMHGTRAVQKLLEHVTTRNQRAIIMSALTPGVVALTKDINGHHVVLHCLKQLSVEENRHLLNEVANRCFEIATDKSGCCVLQQCVNHAEGAIKDHLVYEIVQHVLKLAKDCYGNYVVQHLISLRIAAVTESMLIRLQGSFVSLSCNKYASNVVEKFLLEAGEKYSTPIILELLQDRYASMLLVDPFGNYVIRSALVVSKGHIRDALLVLIERNSSKMRTNLYGKKLLARFDRGNLRFI